MAVLFLAHLGVLWHFAVDVPYWDEWDYLRAGAQPLDAELTWEYLFVRHNEHRIVFARLQTWLLYRVDGWNLVTQQVLNFLFYGAGVAWLVWVCRRLAPELPAWALLGGAVFMLSPLGWENFTWGFQSSTHQALFAFLIAVWLLGGDRPHPVRLALGALVAVLAVLSQSAGVTAVASLAGSWAAWKASRAWAAEAGATRRGELFSLAAVVIPVGLAVALWSLNYPRLDYHPDYAWPWSLHFWRYLLSVVSLGFGFRSRTLVWGVLCFALVVAPMLGLLWRGRSLEPQRWTVVAMLVGLLVLLATIALARAGIDPDVRHAKSSRYAAFAQPLVPIAMVAWAAWLRDGVPRPLAWLSGRLAVGPLTRLTDPVRARVLVLGLVWGLACCGHGDDWSLKHYRETHTTRTRGLEQVLSHGAGPLRCELYPFPLEDRLAEARRQSLSFTR